MQIETFKETLLNKFNSKKKPVFEKAQILFQTIDRSITNRQSEKTAIFVAILQSLQTSNAQCDAQLLLLSWFIPLVSQAVVQRVIPQLLEIVDQTLSIEPGYALNVGGHILALSSKEDLQKNSKIQQLYLKTLEYSVYDKKPVRKTCIKALQQFFKIRKLEIPQHYYDGIKDHFSRHLSGNSDTALFAVTTLSQLQQYIPYSLVIDSLYLIIEQLNNFEFKLYPILFLSLEQILEHSFGADQIEKLIQNLLQLQPEDINAQHAYIQCLRQAFFALEKSSAQLAAQYLPSVLSTMIEFLLSENEKVQQHTKGEIVKILPVGSKTLNLKADLATEIMSLELESPSSFQQKYLAMLSYLLSNRFDHANVLDIYAAFFSTVNENSFSLIEGLLLDIVKNRKRWSHVHFEKTIGALAQAVPLRCLLKLFPLRLDNVDPLALDFDEKSNTWLLFILSRYSRPSLGDYLNYLSQYWVLLKMVQSSEQGEQKLMLNIVTHLIEIAGNCEVSTKLNEAQRASLDAFFLVVLENINYAKPFYSNLLLMISKLYSQIVSDQPLRSSLGAHAQQYIAVMAKIVIAHPNQSQLTLNAIKVVAFAAPQPYLIKKFKSNMDRILNSKEKLDQTMLKNMDIVLQVVSALEFTSDLWDYCLNFCQMTVQTTQIQKKVYKLLSEIMKKVHPSFLEQASSILLQFECIPSARQKRFQAIHSLLENQFHLNDAKFDLESFQGFLQNFLPEIVISVRDKNGKTRQQAEKLLQTIGEKLLAFDYLEQFISMVFAGLAASSNAMKADAIVTISILLGLFFQKVHQGFKDEINSLIFMLLKEENNEIYKAIVQYMKMLVKQKANIRGLLGRLLDSDGQSLEKNQIQIKHLLIRMVKVYGQEMIDNEIRSEKHQKMLKNALRFEKYQKRKKDLQKQSTTPAQLEQKLSKLDIESAGSDSDVEAKPKPKPQKASLKQGKQARSMEMEGEQTDNNILLKYDFKKEQFHFEEPQKKKQNQTQVEQKAKKQPLVEFKDGKIIVNEQKEVLGQKRRSQALGDDQPEIIRKQKNEARSGETVHVVRESGQAFQLKGGKGDVLIKGRPEPFAFIQLNPKALNRRFKQKAARTLDNVFQKKGSLLKGLRASK